MDPSDYDQESTGTRGGTGAWFRYLNRKLQILMTNYVRQDRPVVATCSIMEIEITFYPQHIDEPFMMQSQNQECSSRRPQSNDKDFNVSDDATLVNLVNMTVNFTTTFSLYSYDFAASFKTHAKANAARVDDPTLKTSETQAIMLITHLTVVPRAT